MEMILPGWKKSKITRVVLIAVVWLFSWAILSLTWLHIFSWIQLGVTLLLFTVPGMTLSIWLIKNRLTLLTHFISGLALSILLVGLLGLAGRIFQLPFAFIKPVFVVVGNGYLAKITRIRCPP